MGASRIEQLIEDIYEFVESCRMQPLSSTKVIVPKDELYDLLDELRLRTPDEIKRYQKIIANRDAIIADAEEKAEGILRQTKEKSKELLNEHEIMQQAYYQANEMIMQASEEAERIRREAAEEAEQIRTGALVYSNDVLTEVERVLANAYDTAISKYDSFIGTLKSNLEIINNNKRELSEQLYAQENPSEQGTVNPEYEDDFNFDENTFIDGAQ
ncbi:ATPase [Lachnospiraceae bacterium MD1]|jgi:vacuolar-type H+-ATPase subunit H|uniref:ATPase n=1 Tax=Variimorphobacter saccharofermentans TaxID=2755051 RepID=A0A839K166_9FIRM|nr:HrpE/YscL family type III secretion apparatus protein [Variimorphobacter saccharofermentans]MBB2183653.1 ATPase [Variimorphobacter saccharofermentans]